MSFEVTGEEVVTWKHLDFGHLSYLSHIFVLLLSLALETVNKTSSIPQDYTNSNKQSPNTHFIMIILHGISLILLSTVCPIRN